MTVTELSCSCQNLVLEAMAIGGTYYLRWHLQPSRLGGTIYKKSLKDE